MRHPEESILALYAGADLPLWRRWRIRLHLRRCDRCRAEVQEFRRMRETLAAASQEAPFPEAVWERIAAEMQANIRLALAAGACVAAHEPARRRPWARAAALAAPVLLLALVGVWLQHSRPQGTAPGSGEDLLLEATGAGIELRQGNRAVLILRHPEPERVTLSGSAQGSLRARWVDEETGQVTIQNVYAP